MYGSDCTENRVGYLPGSAQTGAGPSSAWVFVLVAAGCCDVFSGFELGGHGWSGVGRMVLMCV